MVTRSADSRLQAIGGEVIAGSREGMEGEPGKSKGSQTLSLTAFVDRGRTARLPPDERS